MAARKRVPLALGRGAAGSNRGASTRISHHAITALNHDRPELDLETRVRSERLERIKALQLRDGTLAEVLRQLLTAEDLKDGEAAFDSLVARAQKTEGEKKASPRQVRKALKQLKDEAG